MSRPFSLESFDETATAAGEPADPLTEEKWLEAFEKGYKDGWEDAERALSVRQGQVSDAFAQNLMDLSFTLNEARSSVRRDLSSLLRGVLNTLLPDMLPRLIGDQILADLDALADRVSGSVIEVVVAEEQQKAIERMLAGTRNQQVRVVGKPGQALNTALLRFAGGEREIDLPAALAEIAATVDSYFDEQDHIEERAHG